MQAARIDLTPDDLREIEAAARITVHGARLPESVLSLTGRSSARRQIR